MRPVIIAANWKMNKTFSEAIAYMDEFHYLAQKENLTAGSQIIIFPPFPYLLPVLEKTRGTETRVGAQNCHHESKGSFTGEISASMIRSLGADAVIIGHSERRKYFNEEDPMLGNKVMLAIHYGLEVVFCCGEQLEDREKGDHQKVIQDQLDQTILQLDPKEMKKVIIAYEPVWAIGTGKTATPDQAGEMHAFIREQVSKHFGKAYGEKQPILYGGSVKPGNAKELFNENDIDGALVGGASLDPQSFLSIIKAAS